MWASLVDMEEELEVRLQRHAGVYERRSQARTATVQGKRILELLSSGGIVVTNGLAQEMEFTFIAKGRTATSVPDIIGVSESMFRTGTTTRVITNLDIDSAGKGHENSVCVLLEESKAKWGEEATRLFFWIQQTTRLMVNHQNEDGDILRSVRQSLSRHAACRDRSRFDRDGV